jgi:hypothetical protein
MLRQNCFRGPPTRRLVAYLYLVQHHRVKKGKEKKRICCSSLCQHMPNTLKIGAAGSSEISLCIYQTVQCKVPENIDHGSSLETNGSGADAQFY